MQPTGVVAQALRFAFAAGADERSESDRLIGEATIRRPGRTEGEKRRRAGLRTREPRTAIGKEDLRRAAT